MYFFSLTRIDQTFADFSFNLCVCLLSVWITIEFEWIMHDLIEMFFVLTLTRCHTVPFSLFLLFQFFFFHLLREQINTRNVFYESFISTNDILFNVITFNRVSAKWKKKNKIATITATATTIMTRHWARESENIFPLLKIPQHWDQCNSEPRSRNLNNVLVFIRKLIFVGNISCLFAFWRSFT